MVYKSQSVNEITNILDEFFPNLLFYLKDPQKKVAQRVVFGKIPNGSPLEESLQDTQNYRIFVPVIEGANCIPEEIYLFNLGEKNAIATSYPPTLLGKLERIPFLDKKGFVRQEEELSDVMKVFPIIE